MNRQKDKIIKINMTNIKEITIAILTTIILVFVLGMVLTGIAINKKGHQMALCMEAKEDIKLCEAILDIKLK